MRSRFLPNLALASTWRLNGPRQVDQYAAIIADCLKGSGLHYNDLASSLSSSMSPRELTECIDESNHELVSEIQGINRERSVRLIAAF